MRLKDVVDLFMRAQVGQNSYAFMGQGMVEQVLSLRPEDRRALIEEAADVRLYRNKLEDAQHKLKATRENMDRVRLLVREIEPRITQLERQAGRAVKYQELARELASTLHVWYAHQWQEVNSLLLAAHRDARAARRGVRARPRRREGVRRRPRPAPRGNRRAQARDRAARRPAAHACRTTCATSSAAPRSTPSAASCSRSASTSCSAELAALRADERRRTRPDAARRHVGELEAQLEAARAELAAQRARLAEVEQELLRAAARGPRERAGGRARAGGGRRPDAAHDRRRGRRRAPASRRDARIEERRKIINELAAWAREFARDLARAALVGPQLEWAIADRARESDAHRWHRARAGGARRRDARAAQRRSTP